MTSAPEVCVSGVCTRPMTHRERVPAPPVTDGRDYSTPLRKQMTDHQIRSKEPSHLGFETVW